MSRRYYNRIFITPVKYCHGKVIYDKKTAITAANKRFEENHIKLRVYPCPDCGHWHLTHTKV